MTNARIRLSGYKTIALSLGIFFDVKTFASPLDKRQQKVPDLRLLGKISIRIRSSPSRSTFAQCEMIF
jgi:hypothetical protein